MPNEQEYKKNYTKTSSELFKLFVKELSDNKIVL